MFDFEEQLKKLPDKPGVYIMKDDKQQVIYVGKAISLKNRVRQYFQNSKNQHKKVSAMVKNIAEFEYIITDSELEALILECNLIKKNKPRYNILLKDDKHYPYIKVTVKDDFPRVLMTRRIDKDKAKYYGPYTSAYAVNETIELINKLFAIRACNKVIKKGKKERPCLNYYIGRCIAPCQGNVDKEKYNNIIKQVNSFLSGNSADIIKELEENMYKASENMEYERAADIRNKINSIKLIQEKQKMISASIDDEDIIACVKEEQKACIQIFFIRGGKLTGRENFIISDILEDDVKDILNSFVKQFYAGTVYIPSDILLQEEIEEINIIESYLSEKRGSKVHLKVPQKGDKKKLIEMAEENAKIVLKNFSEKIIKEQTASINALEELSEMLHMEKFPTRIEAFDISNIQGVDPVGSMVVFIAGRPKNSEYRRFKIKSVLGPDDYKSMQEVIERRFRHGLDELDRIKKESVSIQDSKFCTFPDLIMIDGGEGQVNSALEVIRGLNLDIPICGMVKNDKHRTRGLIFEGREIEISNHSETFKLITRIQDEAHRFAITYHRSLRDRRLIKSKLDEIEGIGETRKKALFKYFGTIDNIKNAALEDLKKPEGMNIKAAKAVYDFFHNENARKE